MADQLVLQVLKTNMKMHTISIDFSIIILHEMLER